MSGVLLAHIFHPKSSTHKVKTTGLVTCGHRAEVNFKGS